jgi:hypothetical protein
MPKESKVRSIAFAILFPSSYKPIPLPQIHVDLFSDTLEFAACLIAHLPTSTSSQHLHPCAVVLGCYQVRKARSVRLLVLIWLRPTSFRLQISKTVDF